MGRVPFDQNFWKFRFEIEWNRKFPEIRFEHFTPPIEVVLFSGNLEIPEISCSFGISTRYESAPVPLVVKCYKMAASLSSRHNTGCKTICHSSSLLLIVYSPHKTLGSDFLENCELVVPNFLWGSSPGLHTLPREKFVSFPRSIWFLSSHMSASVR